MLIPAFNAQPWIADAIKSAVGQTYPRKEIIVVDDGSTDRTLSIARQFASKEVNVITQKNQGAAAARNKALSLSHGDYIQWLDADDLLAPDKVAKQVEALEHCPGKRMLLSSAWAYFHYRFYRANFVPTALWCDLSPVEWLVRKMGQNLHMQTAMWLVSRELTEAAGPWDTRLLGGGQLEAPRLSWKYAWIRKVFGWGLAKRAQLYMRKFKASLSWDKALYQFENQNLFTNHSSE